MPHRIEQVAVGADAEALVPRVVPAQADGWRPVCLPAVVPAAPTVLFILRLQCPQRIVLVGTATQSPEFDIAQLL